MIIISWTDFLFWSCIIFLCHPLLLPSIFPSISVFSSEWPKYWSFSFIISPFNEYSGLISFRIDWFYLLAVQGTIRTSLHSRRFNNSAPYLGKSKRSFANSSSEDLNQAYPHPAEFSGQSVLLSWFCRWVKALMGLLPGCGKCALDPQRLIAGCCKNLSTSPSSQIPIGEPLQVLLSSPWCKVKVESPMNWPRMSERVGDHSWVLFHHWRKLGGSQETSGVVLHQSGGRGNAVVASLTLIMKSVSMGQGVLQPHTCVFSVVSISDVLLLNGCSCSFCEGWWYQEYPTKIFVRKLLMDES